MPVSPSSVSNDSFGSGFSSQHTATVTAAAATTAAAEEPAEPMPRRPRTAYIFFTQVCVVRALVSLHVPDAGPSPHLSSHTHTHAPIDRSHQHRRTARGSKRSWRPRRVAGSRTAPRSWARAARYVDVCMCRRGVGLPCYAVPIDLPTNQPTNQQPPQPPTTPIPSHTNPHKPTHRT